jgi:hypothetical protein
MTQPAVTYADVEEREIGKQTKISELADLKIENDIANQERELGAEEQMLSEKSDVAMTEDALAFIDQMDQIHDDGGDPMEMYDRLPPEMQERVSQLLNNERGVQEEQMEASPMDGFQAMPNPQEQGIPQQGNVNITDQAKRIATL